MARCLSDQDINAALSDDRPFEMLLGPTKPWRKYTVVQNESRVIAREELYQLVWAKPGTVLAKEFGMSDVGLAKVCKKLKVPRPYRGYWQLLEAGRKVAIPPLPPARKGDPLRATLSPDYYRLNFKPQDPNVLIRLEAESLPENRIRITENLDSPHRLVRNTRTLLNKGQRDDTGRLVCRQISEHRQPLNVTVSKPVLPRALLIMDALVKALEARDCKVEIKDRQTVCFVGEIEIAFSLWEQLKRTEREPTEKEKREPWRFERWQYTPTGELVFTLEEWFAERKNWRDGKKKRLEDQLNDIVAGVFLAAEKLRVREIERKEDEQRRLEAEQRRTEMERERKIQEERRNQIDAMVASWVKSTHLRQFLQACENLMLLEGKNPDPAGAHWLSWVRAYADALDPTKNGSLKEMIGLN